MIVTSLCDGRKVTGLHIGARNVRRYFPKQVSEIELRIDHLRIECRLAAHFWQDQPEIHDPRLCLWLETKHRDVGVRRTPVSLALIPSGENSFILGPANLDSAAAQSRPARSVNADRKAAELAEGSHLAVTSAA